MTGNKYVTPRDATGIPIYPSRIQSLYNTSALGSNGVYTQPWVDSTGASFTYDSSTIYLPGTNGPADVNFVSGSVYADQAGTLYIDQTDDQTNVQSSSIAVSASTLTQIPVTQLTSRYYRFRYVNGAVAQGTFALSQISEKIDAFSNITLTGRNTQYQRLLASQGIVASGSISTVVNVGIGTKAIYLAYKCTGIAYIALYPCDANGNPLPSVAIAQSGSTGYANNSLILSELGGASYVAIYVFDKSAAANTCNFVDMYWTKA